MNVEDRIKEAFDPIRLPAHVSSIESAGRRKRRVRRASVLAPVVAIVAAAAVLAPTMLPGNHRTSAAAATLHRLAAVAARQPAVSVGPGQYVYSRYLARYETCRGDQGNECIWEDVDRETWVAPDGSGRIRETRGSTAWSEQFRPGELNADDLSKVPTDRDALRAFIEERASKADQPLDYEMFVVVGDLLRESFSSTTAFESPELRSALFEVAASLPGVEYLGDTTDEVGRPGVGVGYTHRGVRYELIFDPATSVFLGERDVRTDGGTTVPGSWASYLESGIVDGTNERP
ncbi:MAG TPA: CU044_5270 family protein [Actinomycetota bacterium]